MRGTVAKRLRRETMKDVSPKFRKYFWTNENPKKQISGTVVNKPDSPRGRYLLAKRKYKNDKQL